MTPKAISPIIVFCFGQPINYTQKFWLSKCSFSINLIYRFSFAASQIFLKPLSFSQSFTGPQLNPVTINPVIRMSCLGPSSARGIPRHFRASLSLQPLVLKCRLGVQGSTQGPALRGQNQHPTDRLQYDGFRCPRLMSWESKTFHQKGKLIPELSSKREVGAQG